MSLILVFMLPLRQNVVGKPERHVVAVDQRLVIFCPVSDFERRECFRTHDFLRLRVVFNGFNEPDYYKVVE